MKKKIFSTVEEVDQSREKQKKKYSVSNTHTTVYVYYFFFIKFFPIIIINNYYCSKIKFAIILFDNFCRKNHSTTRKKPRKRKKPEREKPNTVPVGHFVTKRVKKRNKMPFSLFWLVRKK